MSELMQRMAIATLELTADNFHTEAKVITDAANEIAALRAQRDRLIAALTPSAETKAAYMGEVRDDVWSSGYDENGEYEERRVSHHVSWAAIKDIMALIRKEGGIDVEWK